MAAATEKAKAIDKPHLAIWSAGRSLSWSNESGNSTALAAEVAIYAIRNGFDASNSAMLREMAESLTWSVTGLDHPINVDLS